MNGSSNPSRIQLVFLEPQPFFQDLFQSWVKGISPPIQHTLITDLSELLSLPTGEKQLICKTETFQRFSEPPHRRLYRKAEITQILLLGEEPSFKFRSIHTQIFPPQTTSPNDVVEAIRLHSASRNEKRESNLQIA